jgi:hypothetical protein
MSNSSPAALMIASSMRPYRGPRASAIATPFRRDDLREALGLCRLSAARISVERWLTAA